MRKAPSAFLVAVRLCQRVTWGAWVLPAVAACGGAPGVRRPAPAAPPPVATAALRTVDGSSQARPASDPRPEPEAVAEPSVVPPIPSETTVQAKYLGKELDLSSPLAPYFSSTAALRHQHALAFELVRSLGQGVRLGRWHLDVRTGCPVEAHGDVFVEGRALVRDGSGKVRAYAESVGTGDSAGVWKLYYDDASRLRVAAFGWANVMGQEAEGVVLFDASGAFEHCSSPPGAEPPWPCGPVSGDAPQSDLDPAVAAAVRPEMRAKRSERAGDDGPVEWIRSLDSVAEWSKCSTPYRASP